MIERRLKMGTTLTLLILAEKYN